MAAHRRAKAGGPTAKGARREGQAMSPGVRFKRRGGRRKRTAEQRQRKVKK